MQAHHTELVHISQGNWICKHNGSGRFRDRDKGHPESRASPKQVELEKTSINKRYKPPGEVWGKSPEWTPKIYISFKASKSTLFV